MTRKRGKKKRILKPLLAHKHSGKLVAHKHTSYASLFFLLLVTTVALLGISFSTQAAEDSYGLTGVIPAKKPVTAPTITSPGGGAVANVPVSVTGRCTTDTLVKVFKNEIMAGASICGPSGNYTIPIDLFYGDNTLVARLVNTNEESGPNSNEVKLSYAGAGVNVAAGGNAQAFRDSTATANQLYLKSAVTHKGAYPGEELKWPVEVIGGTPPYAISVGWGDGKTDAYTATSSQPFDIKHRYEKPGAYRGGFDVVVKATDGAGNHAYLQMVSLVNNGSNASKASVGGSTSKIWMLWPALAAIVLMVVSFWLGERREIAIMKRRAAV